MTMQEAASGARNDCAGGGGAGDVATVPSSFAMPYADAVVARTLQQQAAATANDDTDDDVTMDEFLPPGSPSPTENEDAPTNADEEPIAAVTVKEDPLLTIAQPADTEEDSENNEGPTQEKSMDTPSTAPVKMTVAETKSAGGSRATETGETSVTTEAKKSLAGAIPNIIQKLQAKKAELFDALAIPRCHPCGKDGKRVSADQRCLDVDCRMRNVSICSACFDESHKTQEERRHRQSVVSNCPQCQMERVVFYCADCDLSFCTPCFDAIHSLPKVQQHRKCFMEGASGSMLSKANGSKKFRLSIAEMLAAGAAAVTTARTELREAQSIALEQDKAITTGAAMSSSANAFSSSSSSSTALQNNKSTASTAPSENQKELQAAREAREKRKREPTNIDIILVDSDSDFESDETSRIYKATRGTFGSLKPLTSNQKAAAATAVSASITQATEAARATTNWAASAQQQRALCMAARMQQKRGQDVSLTQAQSQRNGHSLSRGNSQSVLSNSLSSPKASASSSNFTRRPSQTQQQQQQQQTPSSQSMAIEPYHQPSVNAYPPAVAVSVGLHNLGIRQVVSSSAYETENSSTLNGMDSEMSGMMQSPPVTEPITTSYLPPAASSVPVTTAMPPVQLADGWDYLDTSNNVGVSPATNGMGPGGVGVHAPMGGMPFDNGNSGGVNGFVMENGNGGGDMPYMGIPSIAAIATATSNNLVTATPSNWMANPLEDILYDRYYQINLYTVNMEQNIMILNARIVQVSTQNLQAAQQLTVTLQKQQSMVLKAQANRLNALVALIVQSHGIMRKVKRLRMDTLCDIPQVATASHKKCVELSQQIALYANNVATLHQQMAITLDSANAMNPNAFHQNVSAINQSIQINEQSIAGWKEERENEIVRIVQYTTSVREELKRAFHQQKPPSGASSSSAGSQQQQNWQRQQSHPQQHNGYHR